MRILHVDTGREMRGGQWQVLRLLEGLAEAGEEVELLARPGVPLWNAARERGVNVRAASFGAVFAARCDLIHAHDARAHTLAAVAGRHPLVVSRRVAFPVQGGVLSRWKYGRAAHYIAVSEFVKTQLMNAGIAAGRITVVYDGVPVGKPSRLGTRIVAPATNDPRKGSALLRAAAQFAGVEVHYSENLVADLDGAAMLVYITYEEGLGSAALLAMASGVPVIASAVGGLPEIVEDNETGLLVRNTPENIAAAMMRLVHDRALTERLGAEGRRRAEERYSMAAMVRGTLSVYHRVLPC